MNGQNLQEGKPLSFAEILKKEDIIKEKVMVPEWGKGSFVIVQTMTAYARDIWEMIITSFEAEESGFKRIRIDRRNIRAWTVALSLVDEAGKALINPDRLATAEDERKIIEKVEALGKKSGAALDRIFAVCQRISRLRDQDVEELVKGSRPDQVGGSPS